MKPRSTPLPSLRLRPRILALSVAACFVATPAWPLPTGPQVVAGSATVQQVGNTLNITNTPGSIINWNAFSIGASEAVRFQQQHSLSSVLNRVTGGDTSRILGELTSNGRVWLINPNGILFGAGSRVDVNGLIASTLNVSNADFLAGRMNFAAGNKAGSLGNAGTLNAASNIYLIAPDIENSGIVRSAQGEVLLAAGREVSLVDAAHPDIQVVVSAPADQAVNLGELVAGKISVFGALVQHKGTANANRVEVDDHGRIVFRASGDTLVDGGTVSATHANGQGGRIEILGNRVAVTGDATVDASGATGGGTLLVGGDYQGKNPDIPNAQITYFGPDATLKANATKVGAGGTAIVWADDTTRAYGRIEAKGGVANGDGGFVEVSGKRYLDFQGRVDTSAPNGEAGTLLLDPSNINIGGTQNLYGGTFTGSPDSIFAGATDTATISWGTIQAQLGSGNVIITTTGSGGTGNINIMESPGIADVVINHTNPEYGYSYTAYGAGYSSTNDLGLYAHGSVMINAPFGNAATGAITIISGWNEATGVTADTMGYVANMDITFQGVANYSGGRLVTNGNVVLKAADAVKLIGATDNGGAGIDIGGTGTLTVAADKLILSANGFNGHAQITSNGNQTFDIGRSGGNAALTLTGTNLTNAYGGFASIHNMLGTQTFNIHYDGDVTLSGGSGNGLIPAGTWGSAGEPCYDVAVCSNNHARLEAYGGQAFIFSAGGTLSLYGGSAGTGNEADIWSHGAQSISGNPSIHIEGGASGGGEGDYLYNAAEIGSKGIQEISAQTINLYGGAASYGGAYLGGDANTTITTVGDIRLYGGSSTSASNEIEATPAFIGSENALTLNVGGQLYMASVATGYGSQAGVGAGTTLNVYAYGGIAASGASALSPAGFGNYDMAAGGTASIYAGRASAAGAYNTAGAVGISFGAYGGIDGFDTVNLHAYYGGDIVQNEASRIITGTLNASASGTIGLIQLVGLMNAIGTINLVATGDISYVGTSNVSLGTLTSQGGDISVESAGTISLAGTVEAMGVTAGEGTITLAGTRILDSTPGSGSALRAQNFNLTSTAGAADANSIAISADINTTGAGTGGVVTATVESGTAYGGISLRNLSTAAWSPSDISFYDYSSYGGGPLGGIANSVQLTHAGSLDLAGTIDEWEGRNLLLKVVGNLDMQSNSSISSTGNLYLDAGNLGSYGGSIVADGGLFVGVLGNIALSGGAELMGSGVQLTLKGSTSELSLAEGALISASNTVGISFTTRTSGGISIDGETDNPGTQSSVIWAGDLYPSLSTITSYAAPPSGGGGGETSPPPEEPLPPPEEPLPPPEEPLPPPEEPLPPPEEPLPPPEEPLPEEPLLLPPEDAFIELFDDLLASGMTPEEALEVTEALATSTEVAEQQLLSAALVGQGDSGRPNLAVMQTTSGGSGGGGGGGGESTPSTPASSSGEAQGSSGESGDEETPDDEQQSSQTDTAQGANDAPPQRRFCN